ncbi:hypothetical protein F0562_010951 [Nyssa sinensis]|uniref:Receptor-like serine/threonine-protein kinase n=1 Tax=Nyssa sinensis TaxID=561372 RepID=A0A5J5A3D8_9ASTE|nr:hypothetical protein F0562_010951 [Nyssa sinensis]
MRSIIYFFSCTFLLFCSSLLYFSAAKDVITAGSFIRQSENLTSAGKRFQLGFFIPDGEYNYIRYVGIWYMKDPATIMWVANRETPLADFTATGYFGIAEDGNLKVLSENGTSFFSTNLPRSTSGRTVKLMDSGNLVLSDDLSGNVIWQSFENPTDTFLPGMKMVENLKLTSWTSWKDPRSGNFIFLQDPEAENDYLIRNRSKTYWKSGESSDFISYTEILISISSLLSNFNGRSSSSVPSYETIMLWMNPSGQIQYFGWDNKNGNWSSIWSAPGDDKCSLYNFCGNFGSCNSKNRLVCKCLPGFKPNSPDNWNSGDFSGGCTRKSTICPDIETTFLNPRMMKVGKPDLPFEDAVSEEDCKKECLNNCQCEGYAFVGANITRRRSPDTSCWLWTEPLSNLQEEFSAGGQDFYARTVSLERSTTRNCEPCGTNMIPYPLSTGSNCGDPAYSNFSCNSLTGQVSFQTATKSYRVTSINPDTQNFVIQAKGDENCGKINSRQLKPSSSFYVTLPFDVTDLCYVEMNISSVDKLLQGRDEVEIRWYPPLEPLCNSPTDCKDWPNSNCRAGRCHCNPNYVWNGSLLNCTQESVLGNNPNQIGESGLKAKEKSISLKAAVISVIVVVAILLLCGTSYITYKRKMGARRQESRESLQGNPVLQLYDSERRVKDLIDSHQLEEDDKAGIDVPYFDLESILVATNNFSDANKLGQGGFGPVYKLMLMLMSEETSANCLNGFGDWMVLVHNDTTGQDLYVSLHGSEFVGNGQTGKLMDRKRSLIAIAAASLFIGLLLICGFGQLLRGKSLRWHERINGSLHVVNSMSSTSGVGQNDRELLSFSLQTILSATDNFSEENKLGEGGFGPVYKLTVSKLHS